MDDCIILYAWFCCYSCGLNTKWPRHYLPWHLDGEPACLERQGRQARQARQCREVAAFSGVDLITSLPKKGGQIKIIHIYILYIRVHIWSCFLKPENMGGLHYSIPNIRAANLNKSSQCYPWHGEMVHIAPPNQGSQTGSRAKWLNTVNGGHLSANLQVP